MEESKSDPSNTIPDKDVKAPNILERTKDEIEAILHKKSHHHHKESHGMGKDIDDNTPVSDVKAPNVFERVQEEIEALAKTIHPKKEAKSHGSNLNATERRDGTMKVESEPDNPDCGSQEKVVKAPNLIERAKEEFKTIVHKGKSPRHHHKETHGRSDDIDENTPISKVKGPNVFERAKEEIEALVQTIHPKKESGNPGPSPKKEEREAKVHKVKSPQHHHHKETHGMSDDIDENTPIGEVRGPSVFQRAKEEIEALVQTIHPKKESANVVSSPKKEG